MSDPHRAHCQGCGRHRAEVGGISWSGLCRDCALAAVDANLTALDEKRGYEYTRYLRGMARYLERAALDAGLVAAHTSGRDA